MVPSLTEGVGVGEDAVCSGVGAAASAAIDPSFTEGIRVTVCSGVGVGVDCGAGAAASAAMVPSLTEGVGVGEDAVCSGVGAAASAAIDPSFTEGIRVTGCSGVGVGVDCGAGAAASAA